MDILGRRPFRKGNPTGNESRNRPTSGQSRQATDREGYVSRMETQSGLCKASDDWASFQTKFVSAEPIHGLLYLRDTRGHLICQFGRHGAAGSRSCITTSILAIRSLSAPISDRSSPSSAQTSSNLASNLASRSLKSSRMSLRRSLISPRTLPISALNSARRLEISPLT